ncbi:CHASE3 domain-containing protein [Massilia sp. TS11]|uniref:CHASE3 domain-containing protein n=1 Tax=Massilia sp. TS11 TaxID=2908003 RepID=UPI001ED9ED3A|nr:CHASE3 domain-containing protein [Massilia sp. TS11]MCG2584047.1 CHASE3 domain-containing protein [Massilia sp. TS11]
MDFFHESAEAPRLPLYQTVLLLVCVLILVVNALSLSHDLQSLKSTTALMSRTAEVADRLQYVNVLVMDAESSERGYFISGDEAYLGPARQAPEAVERELRQLESLLLDNPSQLRNLRQLRQLIESKLQLLDEGLEVYRKGGLSDIVRLARIGEGRSAMDEVRLQVVIMVQEQDELLKARTAQFYNEYQKAVLLGIGINALAILVLVLFYRLVRRGFFKRIAAERQLKESNENLEMMVSRRTEQLSVLSRHLINVSETEKAKLARELHDEMGAKLTAINMDLASVASKLQPEQGELLQQLQRARQMVQHTVALKRRIVEDLRPSILDNLGLKAALESYTDEFTKLSGIPCDTLIAGDVDAAGPMHTIAIFRIVQESLNNVLKYAKARHVIVELEREDGHLLLRVTDDGIGIDTDAVSKPRSHGLVGMRERALLLGGSLHVGRGINGVGTVLSASLPLATTTPSSVLHP